MNEFISSVKLFYPGLSSKKIDLIYSFYKLVMEENRKQNLTRIVDPIDFIRKNVLDVKNLLESGFISYPALDFGSGFGVPGLLSSIIDEKKWVLTESKPKKSDFLKKTIKKLSLSNVLVFSGKAEHFLLENKVSSIVVRAIGTIDLIYSKIKDCSTWNNLILLKGPKWEEEFSQFIRKKPLDIHFKEEIEYKIDKKANIIRKIIQFNVPRGT